MKLSKAFKNRGFIYEQVARGNFAACYQLTSERKTVGFESFIIQTAEPMANFGETSSVSEAPKEKLPSNEQFGYRGFAFTERQREEALQKFEELEAQEKEKKEAGL
jgi:hypothetical protein